MVEILEYSLKTLRYKFGSHNNLTNTTSQIETARVTYNYLYLICFIALHRKLQKKQESQCDLTRDPSIVLKMTSPSTVLKVLKT